MSKCLFQLKQFIHLNREKFSNKLFLILTKSNLNLALNSKP
jgi:hypothetical protein